MADLRAHSQQIANVEGIYRQKDVRMRRVNPPQLFTGHAGVVMDDGHFVFLYPPGHELARRDQQEIEAFEHKRVRVKGQLLTYLPQQGGRQQASSLKAPCVIDIESIDLI
jgi:hypothetical protein